MNFDIYNCILCHTLLYHVTVPFLRNSGDEFVGMILEESLTCEVLTKCMRVYICLVPGPCPQNPGWGVQWVCKITPLVDLDCTAWSFV